jgi:hypothetical protein
MGVVVAWDGEARRADRVRSASACIDSLSLPPCVCVVCVVGFFQSGFFFYRDNTLMKKHSGAKATLEKLDKWIQAPQQS